MNADDFLDIVDDRKRIRELELEVVRLTEELERKSGLFKSASAILSEYQKQFLSLEAANKAVESAEEIFSFIERNRQETPTHITLAHQWLSKYSKKELK